MQSTAPRSVQGSARATPERPQLAVFECYRAVSKLFGPVVLWIVDPTCVEHVLKVGGCFSA